MRKKLCKPCTRSKLARFGQTFSRALCWGFFLALWSIFLMAFSTKGDFTLVEYVLTAFIGGTVGFSGTVCLDQCWPWTRRQHLLDQSAAEEITPIIDEQLSDGIAKELADRDDPEVSELTAQHERHHAITAPSLSILVSHDPRPLPPRQFLEPSRPRPTAPVAMPKPNKPHPKPQLAAIAEDPSPVLLSQPSQYGSVEEDKLHLQRTSILIDIDTPTASASASASEPSSRERSPFS